MDFSKFEKVENTYVRKASSGYTKEQAYEFLKFKKVNKKTKNEAGEDAGTVLEGRFYISNAFFAGADLSTHGLRQFTAPDGETILAVVADADAAILKLSKKSKVGAKSKNFKSPKLETSLERMKLLDQSIEKESQYFDLNLMGSNVDIKGVNCIKVYTFVKGVAKTKAPKETMSAAPVTATTAPTTAPVAAGWED